LDQITAQVATYPQLLGILNTDGDHLDTQRVGHADQLGQHHPLPGIRFDALDEMLVDLDEVRFHLMQHGQPVGGAAEVVERQHGVAALEQPDAGGGVGAVGHGSDFGHHPHAVAACVFSANPAQRIPGVRYAMIQVE
jgi:hypothetical protein